MPGLVSNLKDLISGKTYRMNYLFRTSIVMPVAAARLVYDQQPDGPHRRSTLLWMGAWSTAADRFVRQIMFGENIFLSIADVRGEFLMPYRRRLSQQQAKRIAALLFGHCVCSYLENFGSGLSRYHVDTTEEVRDVASIVAGLAREIDLIASREEIHRHQEEYSGGRYERWLTGQLNEILASAGMSPIAPRIPVDEIFEMFGRVHHAAYAGARRTDR